jgi:hypothetical protein
MSRIKIPPKVWKAFLETFTERHAGWLIQVETHDTETDETVTSQISALHSIELDDEDEKNPRINVTVLYHTKELKHILFRPSQVTLHIFRGGRKRHPPNFIPEYRHNDPYAWCEKDRCARHTQNVECFDVVRDEAA